MREVLYIEVPTTDHHRVRHWLQESWLPVIGQKVSTVDGIRLQDGQKPAALSVSENATENVFEDAIQNITELSLFVWSVQRTTYLKVFRWGDSPFAQERRILKTLVRDLRQAFPIHYPDLPQIDITTTSIFEALDPHYPLTVHFFKKMPQGEQDLTRVYWWEKRWRDSVTHPQQPKEVVIYRDRSTENTLEQSESIYDLIYIGGALGAIHGAAMARLGYRVLLVERLAFGRMNREWNISRSEFESLIALGLFTRQEFEGLIAREYRDGFNKFFDGNNPVHLRSAVLQTPTVLNIALDSSRLLQLCGEKLVAAGGKICDRTEFIQAVIDSDGVTVQLVDLDTGAGQQVRGRMLIDAMGTASPIAWQLNGKRTFDSVCPTVGAVIEGLEPTVWDADYGDVLNSHGDISRGRQLIWELFPGMDKELTFYLFHYHQVHPDNPGSLLEMYEDFFAILPEYRRCDPEQLTWKKPTFGYIPGHFSGGKSDRKIAFDRLLAIGDAASLQSPLIFTGFGSLVRNLGRLTHLLDTALKHNLLAAADLEQIRAYQSNVAVTWLFSKGMMVPTHRYLPPQRVNAMLNTFFGLLADSSPEVAETFIKDRTTWLMFSRLAIKAATKNPKLLLWIWEMAGWRDLARWLGVYLDFTLDSVKNTLFKSWFPQWLKQQTNLEQKNPKLWLRLLSFSYRLRG
jgi:lycopene cyclase CruA